MAWTDGRDYDPEATVLLPVVPANGLGIADTTMLMPLMARIQADPARRVRYPEVGRAATGQHPADATVRYAPPHWPSHVDDPTMVFPAVPVRVPPAGGGVTGSLGARHEQPSVVRSSAIMAIGSLVSRVTGLMRTVAIGAVLGAAAVGNDYNLSNTLPNMVYELLLGGVLASVLVPFLMRARIKDADRGEAYAQRLLTLATVLLGAATLLAVLAAPLLTKLFTITQKPRPAAADLHLITTLSYLILPEIFFYGMAALIAAILNTRGHFAAPTWTPILNNVVVIATAGAYFLLPKGSGASRGVDPTNITTAQILVLGIGTTLGIVIQAAGLWPALRGVRFRWKWRFDWGELRLRELGRASGWMLTYVGVSQIALVTLLILITAASGRKLADGTLAPGLTIYNSAFLIFMMAHGIVAVSIMTAMMPRMSAAAAEGRFADLATQFSQGTRLSAVVLIPATAAYIVLGRPLSITLFQWSAFTHQQALQTATVIAVSALGLVPFAISQMQLFAFYAMPDTRTPALMNMPVAALRVLLDVLFYLVLPYALVAAGLMMANTVSYVLGAVIGYQLLRKRIGRLGLGDTMVALGRLAGAAVIAAVSAWFVVLICQHTIGTGKVPSIVTLIGGGVVLIGCYVAASVALGARDVTDMFTLVRGRFGR
jgi:putative peptidoglycan lipid II flippase